MGLTAWTGCMSELQIVHCFNELNELTFSFGCGGLPLDGSFLVLCIKNKKKWWTLKQTRTHALCTRCVIVIASGPALIKHAKALHLYVSDTANTARFDLRSLSRRFYIHTVRQKAPKLLTQFYVNRMTPPVWRELCILKYYSSVCDFKAVLLFSPFPFPLSSIFSDFACPDKYNLIHDSELIQVTSFKCFSISKVNQLQFNDPQQQQHGSFRVCILFLVVLSMPIIRKFV